MIFFSQLPAAIQPLLHSGILLATVCAVSLNLYFNGYHPDKELENDNGENEIVEEVAK